MIEPKVIDAYYEPSSGETFRVVVNAGGFFAEKLEHPPDAMGNRRWVSVGLDTSYRLAVTTLRLQLGLATPDAFQ